MTGLQCNDGCLFYKSKQIEAVFCSDNKVFSVWMECAVGEVALDGEGGEVLP